MVPSSVDTVGSYVGALQLISTELADLDVIIGDSTLLSKVGTDLMKIPYYKNAYLAFLTKQDQHQTFAELQKYFLQYELKNPRSSLIGHADQESALAALDNRGIICTFCKKTRTHRFTLLC